MQNLQGNTQLAKSFEENTSTPILPNNEEEQIESHTTPHEPLFIPNGQLPNIIDPNVTVKTRKTIELIITPEDSPQKEQPTLKRANQIIINSRQLSGYFHNDVDLDTVQVNDYKKYVGAKDNLTIAPGSKVIVDIGRYAFKIGLITDDYPRRRLFCVIDDNDNIIIDDTLPESSLYFPLDKLSDEDTSNKVMGFVTRVINEIYKVVLRGCDPKDYPVFCNLQTQEWFSDVITQGFKDTGVMDIEFFNPYEMLLQHMDSKSGLIIDIGNTLSISSIIEGNIHYRQEMDNLLIEGMKKVLKMNQVDPTLKNVFNAFNTAFCNEKINVKDVQLNDTIINFNQKLQCIIEDELFNDNSLIEVFQNVLNNSPRTSRRLLIGHILVIGGFAMDGIEIHFEKEIKKSSTLLHIQPRDVKVLRLSHPEYALWNALKDTIKQQYNN
ncbi:actin [Entamoeba marina]